MTLRPDAQFSVYDARLLLREAGLRCTAARIAVIQSLANGGAPMSMNDVIDDLADFGFDKSTIYRTLLDLDTAGVAVMLELGNSSRRFELSSAAGDEPTSHPHFLCTECGKLICLPGYCVNVTPVDPSRGLPGELTEILLKGRCDSCM